MGGRRSTSGVDDESATFESVESRGAMVRERPGIAFRSGTYDLWIAFAMDPDGHNIGLMGEAPPGTERG